MAKDIDASDVAHAAALFLRLVSKSFRSRFPEEIPGVSCRTMIPWKGALIHRTASLRVGVT